MLIKHFFVKIIVILFLLVFLFPKPLSSMNSPFSLKTNRNKVAVVPGGLIQFRFSITNNSPSAETFLISSSLVNQSQDFSFRLLYQNQLLGASLVINPSISKEIVIEVPTTQKTPISAKGGIKVSVNIKGNPDIQKQELLFSFILTKQITMILKQNSTIVQLSDQDPVTLEVAPYILGGRTFVPLRFIGESFGAKIDWVASEKKIIYTLRGQEIVLWINQTKMLSNGTEKIMDAPPEIKPPGRTFVPLRIISEELGAKVEWNDITRQIKIIFTVSTS